MFDPTLVSSHQESLSYSDSERNFSLNEPDSVHIWLALSVCLCLSFLEVYQAAMDLYGLIHARFILSPRGLAMMREKFLLGAFGMCQRILCDRQVVLPIGLSEELSTSRVKIFCPRCQEVYVPRQKHLDIDGAYFGISFANILFKTYPDLYPKDGPLTY